MLKRYLKVPLSLALALIVFVSACSPATLAKRAEQVGNYAVKTKPLFQALMDAGSIPNSDILKRIDQIAADTKILADALRSGSHATVLESTATVINGIEALIEQDAELIKDPKRKAQIIGWLTAAEIALGIIVDSFPETPPTGHHALFLTQEQKKAIETIKKFRAKVRCRMAGTVKDGDKTYRAGQFAKMEMCRKYPDKTVVERIKPKN